MSHSEIEQELRELKNSYLSTLPQKHEEMLQLFLLIRQQPARDLIEKLQLLAHRMRGTTATYGFQKVSDCAFELEHCLTEALVEQNYPWESLNRLLDELKHQIDSAHTERFESSSAMSIASKGHLLVVDDDSDFLLFMSTLLTRQGFQVTTEDDPERVLALINDTQPELLLIDVEMPSLSGYDLCRLLMNDEKSRELPIIFLTAHHSQEHRIAAFRAGADDFINKPIVTEELLARVNVRLARARLAHEKQSIMNRLQNQHESLLSILDQMQNGTVLLDNNGIILFMSRSCGSLGGINPEIAVGRPWLQAFPFAPKSLQNIDRQLQGDRPEQLRLHIDWRFEGRHYFVEVEVKDVPGRPGLSLLYFYDQSELQRLRRQIEQSRFHEMVGNSKPMRQMYHLIEQVARGDWTVLIEGETGVGKELVAHSIHAASPRKDRPFIAVNSAGLSESLLSSQLFGHRRGAFTGAVADQEGFFEAAAGGTLFLDEIGDISLSIQAALLRVVQEREITRLGESRTRKVDVRIIAATHKDLTSEMKAGRFREDLLYRLRVARIYVPALRERKADIPMLTQVFLAESCHTARIPVKQIGTDALRLLQNHDWPGNVRELKATLDYAVIRSRTGQLSIDDLPPEIGREAGAVDAAPELIPANGDERIRILFALEKTGGNRSHAAKLLGIGRATLYRRLKELNIAF